MKPPYKATVIEAKDLQKFHGKSVTTLKRLAILHFHHYIRLRDSEGEYFECISCGQYKSMDQCNAGHYMSGGNFSVTRFDPDNVHAQCVKCNHYLSGNLEPYRKRLIEKIGLERVEAVEQRARSGARKIERMDLIMIILEYKEKCKQFT